MSVVAVVPLRGGPTGKSRLAARLAPEDRALLVGVLARHVVGTLLAAPGVDRVLVVTQDVDATTSALADLGASGGLDVVAQPDGRPGLNAAVTVGRELALAGSPGAAGRPRVLVVHGDLPALTAADVDALLAAPGAVVLAPDRLGVGTNAVVVAGHVPFTFRFGADSCAAHRDEAARHGVVPDVVVRPGTAVDLDTAEDWDAYPQHVRRRLADELPALAALDPVRRAG